TFDVSCQVPTRSLASCANSGPDIKPSAAPIAATSFIILIVASPRCRSRLKSIVAALAPPCRNRATWDAPMCARAPGPMPATHRRAAIRQPLQALIEGRAQQRRTAQGMRSTTETVATKVPEVTLVFWIIKIAATTLGETGGDTATMTLNWGYLAGTALFLAALIVLVAAQIAAKKFHPVLYWATIVASTTFGTTMADFADRSLGIGYAGGASLLFVCLMAILALWYWSERSISVNTVTTPRTEMFYWAAITFSQTLGTALGVIVALYYWTSLSHVAPFWAAFILTRPLGATVGDFLDKPIQDGGLALSRPLASLVLAIFIIGCIIILPQRAGRHPGRAKPVTG